MKTRSFHIDTMGIFSGNLKQDADGNVTVHDDDRYKTASDEQLIEWSINVRNEAIHNAAQTELNLRAERRYRERKGL